MHPVLNGQVLVPLAACGAHEVECGLCPAWARRLSAFGVGSRTQNGSGPQDRHGILPRDTRWYFEVELDEFGAARFGRVLPRSIPLSGTIGHMGIGLLVAIVVVVLWVVWEFLAARRSPHSRVRRRAGADVIAEMAASRELPNLTLDYNLSSAVKPGTGPAAGRHRTQRKQSPGNASTATVAGVTAGIVQAADLWRVDQSVLDAAEHLTGESLSNGLDLWSVFRERDYALASQGFETMFRGHVAEHELFGQLDWAGDLLKVPEASNHPVYDFSLGGHEFNVKVGQDFSAVREHLATYPDIPVVVNSDMANLPGDAFPWRVSEQIDPSLLSEHSVVVADALELSGIQESIIDAIGPELYSWEFGDLFEAHDLLPGIGTAILVVRSGIREGRLAQQHGSGGRAIGNVAVDAAVTGGGVVAGSWIGGGIGAFLGGPIGLTVGKIAGATVGGFLGRAMAWGIRMGPLTEAQEFTAACVTEYSSAVNLSLARANTELTKRRLPPVARNLKETAGVIRNKVNEARDRAERELAQTETALEQDLAQAIDAAHYGAHQVRGSVIAAIRRRVWEKAVAEAELQGWEARLNVLLAIDGGEVMAREVIVSTSAKRARIVATFIEQNRRAQLLAKEAKGVALAQAIQARKELEVEVARDSYPYAALVYLGSMWVREELVNTGACEPEWVEANIPDPDLPPRPPVRDTFELVTRYLSLQDDDIVTLPIGLLEILLDGLPDRAVNASWWESSDARSAWRSAGYSFDSIDLDNGIVTFVAAA